MGVIPAAVRHTDPEQCVEATLARVGKNIVMGLPVALGKPNTLVNAFVRRALRDRSLQLHILTGLSFRTPRWRSDLERRFLQPFVQRVFGDYPELEYVRLLEAGKLPKNITVSEFFLEPGAWLNNPHQQQQYLSANYTHVVRDALRRGLNVMAQLVAAPREGEAEPGVLSLSCNPDMTADLLPEIAALRAAGKPFALVGQIHRALPFMYGDALVAENSFDVLLDERSCDFPLFAPPNMPIGTAEHHIALNVTALVKDGGTLQLGIGELGDAIVYALQLRHEQPAVFRQVIGAAGLLGRHAPLVELQGGTQPFDRGLYGCSEMLADGFLDLYAAGVLKRRVYASARLQRLLDEHQVTPELTEQTLEALYNSGVQHLSFVDFKELQDVGLFREDIRYEAGVLVTPSGVRTHVDLADPECREQIARHCMGSTLSGSTVLDAGFFFGPHEFYAKLRRMSPQERRNFNMRGISFINELYGPESELKIAQRRHARFINTAMMVTGLGAAVSDGLADGRVVSGVGGQYNFVAMAHALPEARSILCLRSVRFDRSKLRSNIVWNYGHVTIPRHLRDIVVTEYGVADLRGKTDCEVVTELAQVMDARFQDAFLDEAQRSGKIPANFRLPDAARRNLPQRLEATFAPYRERGLFPALPSGTDFTEEEIVLGRALKLLQSRTQSAVGRAGVIARALVSDAPGKEMLPYLARLELERPITARGRVERKLVSWALREILAPAPRK